MKMPSACGVGKVLDSRKGNNITGLDGIVFVTATLVWWVLYIVAARKRVKS